LKISPIDIYNREFGKSTFGYNVKQVDEFIEEVGMAYERLLKELNLLQDENEKLREKVAAQEEMEDKLQRILLTVQETAREITEQAHKEADLIIKKAELKAERLEREAKIKLQEEYKSLQSLKETRELFKIRLKTMLEGYLELINNTEELDEDIEKDVAVKALDLEDVDDDNLDITLDF